MAVRTKLTIEDFEKLPQEAVDYKELVDGELVDVSGNNPKHNVLRDELAALIRRYVKDHKLGAVITEQEYAFGEDAHGPDITFFGPAKLALLDWDKRIQPFLPDLAIEIRSPNDSRLSLKRKAEKYRQFGVTEVWVFDQSTREALIFRASDEAVLDDSHRFEPETIPGFSVALSDLFDLKF